MSEQIVLKIENLEKHFKVNNRLLRAVDGASLSVPRGTTFGLVGESGCGKTTLGRSILRMHPITSGKISYEGHDIFDMSEKESWEYSKKVQMIFQDPFSSLDPTQPINRIVAEGMEIHGLYNKKERAERIEDLLQKVGISKECHMRFPHEFSGGQRQRVGIARALALEPEFIVCDEPISALDVSIQAQIVNLLQDLQQELGLSYLFIAHDLSMVKYISDIVAVMYLGWIVECTRSDLLYKNPLHPYTQALLSAIPIPDPRNCRTKKRVLVRGDIPTLTNETKGCKFCSRCSYAMAICSEEPPANREVEPGHYVACHKYL